MSLVGVTVDSTVYKVLDCRAPKTSVVCMSCGQERDYTTFRTSFFREGNAVRYSQFLGRCSKDFMSKHKCPTTLPDPELALDEGI